MQGGSRRRFIAGAVCPNCGRQDKIVVDLDADERQCIACGFREARPAARNTTSPAELQTRVNRAQSRRVETPAEPVRLVDPPKKSR